MRLFVALEIPAAVRGNLSALMQEFRTKSEETAGKGPRWVRADNLHITLKFIGEALPEKLNAIRDVLEAVRSDEPLELLCRGIGFFPNEKRPQVVWAGLHASGNLATLAEDIDSGLATVGIARETRPFAPHLTLARLNPPRLDERLHAAIAAAAAREFGAFRVQEFHLIESKTRPSGAEYTRIASFRFSPEA